MKIDDAKIRAVNEFVNNNKGLQPKRLSAFSESSRSEMVYFSIDKLIPYKHQARRVFDEQEIEYLAATIKEHGIRQPLTVIAANADSGLYEVVSGERRLRAAKLAGLERVPCIVITNDEKAEEIALIENIQRKNLHPVELSRALNRMMEVRKWGTQTDLKNKLGLPKSSVSELLKLSTLSDKIQDYILQNNIRGRDQLRKLFTYSTDGEKMKYLSALTATHLEAGNIKSNLKAWSLIRLAMEGSKIKVQKKNLALLSDPQKEEVKKVLNEIISSL